MSESCETCRYKETPHITTCGSCFWGGEPMKWSISMWASKSKPVPLLTAAKNLLAFLEDKAQCDITLRGAYGDDGGESIDIYDRYGLVAVPGKELDKLTEALGEAIKQSERSAENG